VRFSILVRSPGELEEFLLNGRIQVGIGYFWHRVPSLEYTEVFAEDQFAYCAKGHPLFASAGGVSPEQAATHEWAWRSYPLPEAESSTTPHNVTAVADNMEAVAMLVLSGHHLGYLPGHFAAPFVEQGLLAALNPELMRYRVAFHMVTRTRQHRTDIVEAFIDDMKAAHAVEAKP
jgi:DNA-binding transcriptional LysR family regulator